MGSSSNPSHKDGVNVQVLLRCRPPTEEEIRTPHVVQCSEPRREVTVTQNVAGRAVDRKYTFDKVFGPKATQETVFKNAVVPIIDEVLEGFNCTIFAYGQTGTGKTYTMEGGNEKHVMKGGKLSPSAGVIPRAINRIFEVLKASDCDHNVRASFLELYNEELTDLWGMNEEAKSTRLKLMEDKSGGVNVNGLEECIVENAAQIQEILERGSAKRKTAETLLNKQSSRSHSIFSVTIRMKDLNKEGEDVFKTGKLNLVDLAGSEDISRSGANQERAREAGSINQSLLTLGRVINALVNNSSHIPYRDSKLTRLLRDSLGGKTKTCIIATVAPTVQCQEETLSTLDYAHRAKNIRNKPEVNQRISQTGYIKELHMQVQKLNQELTQQRQKDGGVYVGTEQYQLMMTESAAFRSQVKDLEENQSANCTKIADLEKFLEEKEEEVATLVKEVEETQHKLDLKSFVCSFHKKAESALADHSINLTRQLEKLSSDYKCAAGLMRASASQSNSNRSLTVDLKKGVIEHLRSLETSLSQLVHSGSGACEAFDNEVNVFENRCQQEKPQILESLKEMYSLSRKLKDCCDQSLDTIMQTAHDGMNKVKGCAEHHLEGARQDVQASLRRLNTVESSLVSATKSIQADLNGFLNRHITMLKGQVESSNAIREKVTGMKRSAANAFAGMREQEKHDEQLFCARSHELKEEFSKQIDGLLQEFMHSKRKKIEKCDIHEGQIGNAGEDIIGLLEDQHMHLDSIQNSVHEKCIGLGHDLKALPAVAEDLRAMAEHAKCQEAHLGENCNELHPTSEICAANTAKVAEEGKAFSLDRKVLVEKAMNDMVRQVELGGDRNQELIHRMRAVSQRTTNNLESLQQVCLEQCAGLHDVTAVKVQGMKWEDHKSKMPVAPNEDTPTSEIVERLRVPPNVEDLYSSSNAHAVLRPTQVLTGSIPSESGLKSPRPMLDGSHSISKLTKFDSRIPKMKEAGSGPVRLYKSSETPFPDAVLDGQNRHTSTR